MGSRLAFRWLAMLAVVLTGCSQECGSSCPPYGAAVLAAPAALGPVEIELCVDGKCQQSGAEGSLAEFDKIAGESHEVSITVRDEAGKVLGSLSETRKVGSEGCGCGFAYKVQSDGSVARRR